MISNWELVLADYVAVLDKPLFGYAIWKCGTAFLPCFGNALGKWGSAILSFKIPLLHYK